MTCRKGSPTPRQGRDQRQAASPILCASAILAPNRRRGRPRREHHGNRDQSRLHGSLGRRGRCQGQRHGSPRLRPYGSPRLSAPHGSPRLSRLRGNLRYRGSAEAAAHPSTAYRGSAKAAANSSAPTEAAALSKSSVRDQGRQEQGRSSNKPKLFHGTPPSSVSPPSGYLAELILNEI